MTTEQVSIDQVLQERGSKYGPFIEHAKITQELKEVANRYIKSKSESSACPFGLAPDQQEALDMIFHKIGRIINGDPNYVDSWIDIAGYAKLVANRLEGHVI